MNSDNLRKLMQQKISTSPSLRSLMKRIQSGKATFRDTAEYSRIYSELLGKCLSDKVLSLDDREAAAADILRDSFDHTNSILSQVQTNIDKKNGINIRPQTAAFPDERVQQFSHSLTDPTVPDETIQRRARNGTANISMSFHDDYMSENAEFRSNAGLRCYIDRQTDGKCCKWCTAIAGRYVYGEEPHDVYRRHDNCGCSVIYENGRQRQDVWSKRTWEKPKKISYKKPTVISPEQARALEQEKLRNIHGLSIDNGAKSDIIEARGYIEDNFDRKISLSSMDEDLKAVNPNWKKLDGYDDNCQRCVPTYVLRRRGFDVEALPTGQNEGIDNLLKQNPHIVWQKAGSPVIPRSTRGSKYFGKPEIEKYMKDLPDGAMCEIRCEWKDEDYGHVFIAEKQNGKVRYIDPQTGKTEVSRYFKDMKPNRTQFWRIDNAALNEDLIKYCCKSKG